VRAPFFGPAGSRAYWAFFVRHVWTDLGRISHSCHSRRHPYCTKGYSEAQLDSSDFLHLYRGKRVLIGEDEYFLADETRRKLEDLGAILVGPAANVHDALEIIAASKIDAAILDVHLDAEFVFPVAEELERRDVAFVFATGHDPELVPVRFTGFALCEKSTELGKIAAALFSVGSITDLH